MDMWGAGTLALRQVGSDSAWQVGALYRRGRQGAARAILKFIKPLKARFKAPLLRLVAQRWSLGNLLRRADSPFWALAARNWAISCSLPQLRAAGETGLCCRLNLPLCSAHRIRTWWPTGMCPPNLKFVNFFRSSAFLFLRYVSNLRMKRGGILIHQR